MYNGFLTFDGVEVINMERTLAYIAAGISPPGVRFENCMGDCTGLGEALGHAPYRSPILDAPPWYDLGNPETYDFAGVFPLGITGLDGSTYGGAVAERVGNGGVALRARRSTRTVAVSALLVGRTTSGVDAGLQWLIGLLTRVCGDTGCGGVALQAFTTCPGPIVPTVDPDGPLVDHIQADDADWLAVGGMWEPSTDTFTVEPAEGGIDGGDAAGTVDPGIDGGDAAATFDPGVDGGDASGFGFLSEGLLAGPVLDNCVGEVIAEWSVTPLSGSVTVATGAVTTTGTERDREDPIVVPGPGATVVTYHLPVALWEEWRPALWVSEPGAIITLNLRYRDPLPVEACLAPYRRTFQGVTLLEAPTVVGEVDTGCDVKLQRVEWTWAVTDPYRYGDEVPLVGDKDASNDVAPTFVATGVTVDHAGTVSAITTACPEPPAPTSCAADPCCPGFIAPPTAPVIPDVCAPAPDDYERTGVVVPPSYVPNGAAGALTFTLANDSSPKVGVRIRFYQDADPAVFPSDDCTFDREVYITYLDADATMTVDGVTGTVTVTCADDTEVDARLVMRGDYGGAFAFPDASCDRFLHMIVDLPKTYPTTCDGVYIGDDPQGTFDWSLAITPREG